MKLFDYLTSDKKRIFIGAISLIFAIYTVIYVAISFISQPTIRVLITEGGIPLELKFPFPPVFIIFAICLFYVSYKTLIKRQMLSKGEVYDIIFLIVVTILLSLLFLYTPFIKE
jgi:heme/copper-type cytochrome/quinol oxidase subunit 3